MKHLIALITLLLLTLPAQAQSLAAKNCIKINGSKVTVLGPECFRKYVGIQGGAHIARRSGGANPYTAIRAAESMNARGVTFVVEGRCESSCWITWNFAKKKCWYSENGQRPTFKQHSRTADKKPVNPHSKSKSYWLAAGRKGPDLEHIEWIEWQPPMSMQCSETVANMPSTDGNNTALDQNRNFNLGIRDKRCAYNVHCQRRDRLFGGRTPSMFQ